MTRMTEAEPHQGFRALADRARREPVTITTADGRDEFVVLWRKNMRASSGVIGVSGLPKSFPRNGSRPCATPRCRTNSPRSTLS
jgi:hypothetical protein